jgi:hypothetical protein
MLPGCRADGRGPEEGMPASVRLAVIAIATALVFALAAAATPSF